MHCLAITALLLSASATARDAAPATVLVVSVDALHPDTLTTGAMPEVRRVMARGRYTLQGRSTSPPKTLIAHTAMLTGLPPEQNGKTDNAWSSGEPTLRLRTIFHVAKEAGRRTAFFYGKEKLGFLASGAVDEHALAPADGVARARRFLRDDPRSLVVLHVSGLEQAGMESGWLSPEYLARARAIDADLGPLLREVERRGDYLVVITSDHAGHGLEHGTDDPEDARLPLVLYSDRGRLQEIQGKPYDITGLMPIVSAALAGPRRGEPSRSGSR